MKRVQTENIPSCLIFPAQWVCWCLETKPGEEKPTKVLYTPKTGKRARTHNSPNPKYPYKDRPQDTWDTFGRANWAYRKFRNQNGQEYSGIGFVFTEEDPFAGLDMDHCYCEGKWTQPALDYAHAIGSYTEISPSGSGIKIFLEGSVPGTKHKAGGFEFYDRYRFFTVTGNRIEHFQPQVEERSLEFERIYWQVFPKPKPLPPPTRSTLILSDQDILSNAISSRNGDKIAALYNGDKSEFADDDSSADASLAWRLAFYTSDFYQLERLMRGSALVRPKWDERRGSETWIGREVRIALEHVQAGSLHK